MRTFSVGVVVVAGLTLLAGCREPAPAALSNGERIRTMRQEAEARGLRQALLDELQLVTLSNCTFRRFGSEHDGGYVMCANLLDEVQSAYSYGIGGNDDWGCDISKTRNVPVHQYDCFNPPNLTCDGGRFVPHAECVGARTETMGGRVFDTISQQISKNGDSGKRLVVKIDVEGAEWDALMATPDDVLERVDQLPMELHGTTDARFLQVVQKLKRQFHIVHLHFNNWACTKEYPPFPSNAYQVLFVNKRVGIAGAPPPGSAPATAFDRPDNRGAPECPPPTAPQ